MHRLKGERASASAILSLKDLLKKNYSFIVLNQAIAIISFFPFLYILSRLFRKKSKLILFERLNPENFFANFKPFKSIVHAIYCFCIMKADFVMTNSIEQAINFRKFTSQRKCAYIPNTCDFEFGELFSPSKANRKIVWIGRLEKVKRADLAIKVMLHLSSEWTLDIIGSGSQLNLLIKLISDLKLGTRVKIYDSFQSLPNAMDCQACLFTSSHEGLPNVIIEMLSLNIPVVSTEFQTGFLELFTPLWVYGSLDTPQALSQALLKCCSINDANLRDQSPISPLINEWYSTSEMRRSFENVLLSL